MIFNLFVFLFIVLITLYLATQGMLSALLALVTATFSSLLAMALTEPLEFLVGKWKIEYQRGLTFLLLFLVVFAITRVVADVVVPKNVRVPLWVNRAAGGFVGFFTALIVVGTLVIGIEMMPLPSTLLGYDRFPGEKNMQGETPGRLARASGVWFGPDRFTLAVWNAASARGLGGKVAFASVHPDLSVENYGYRRNVQYASKHTVPPESFDVPVVWMSNESKDLDPLGVKLEPGKKAVVARTTISKGEKPERSAADSDDTFYRVTPSQVRLVTREESAKDDTRKAGRPYYPVGYLEFGTTYTPLDLESGQLVDDFVRGRVVQDWVFQINEGEVPVLIEVKQTARKPIASVSNQPAPALASGEYPQKPYRSERSSLVVNFSGLDPITEGQVYVLRHVASRKDISAEIDAAFEFVESALNGINSGTGGWSAAAKPGVPDRGFYQTARTRGVDIKAKGLNEAVEWEKSLELLLAGQMQNDASRTLTALPVYINNTLVPLFSRISTGNAVIATAKPEGNKAELRNIPKGSAVIFAWAKTEKGVYTWIRSENFDAFAAGGADKTLAFSANDARPKVER
jgi:hypothetical protein